MEYLFEKQKMSKSEEHIETEGVVYNMILFKCWELFSSIRHSLKSKSDVDEIVFFFDR